MAYRWQRGWIVEYEGGGWRTDGGGCSMNVGGWRVEYRG